MNFPPTIRSTSGLRRGLTGGLSYLALSLFLFFVVLPLLNTTTPAIAAGISKEQTPGSLIREKAIESFKRKDYEQAYAFFQVALTDFPDDLELRKYIANAIAVMAYKEYEDENYYEAIALFEEAIELEEDVEFYKGLAMCRLKLDDIDGALDILLPHKEDPQISRYLVDLYAALGERRYQEGDLEGALHNFLRGAELDYTNSYVMKRLSVLTGEYSAENDFRSKEGSHFIVKYDAGENAVLGNLVSILLEEAYLRIGYDFGHYPEDMIEAVLYTKEQFSDVTRSPAWAGAIYDGRIKIPVGGVTERTELLEGVLFHEYSHAVVHRIAKGKAPMWLNEGIAQYVEGKRVSDLQQEFMKDFIGENRFSLRNLEGSFMGLDSKQAQKAYLMSLSATEYIIREFGSFSAIAILENLGSGDSLDDAISAAIYLPYEELIDSWLRSVRR